MSIASEYLEALGLTDAQKIARKGTIGGSTANIIAGGNRERIFQLWEEFTGKREPENLDDVLPVMFGHVTEMFNAAWFEKMTGKVVVDMGLSIVSPDYDWRTVTLDGLTDDRTAVFQAKHVNQFSKEENVITNYMPQVHHEMDVCGLELEYLSVFVGTLGYFQVAIERDHFYAEELFEKELAFLESVKRDIPPPGTEPIATPTIASEWKTVDMTKSNAWAIHEADYVDNKAANKVFTDAQKELKLLVDADVREATGNKLKITRSKKGSLLFKEV